MRAMHEIEERHMEEKEFAELKKEIIEARNLVIKTDNLLKNIHAEVKLVGRRQDLFERRHLVTSGAAVAMVAILCAAGAFVGARAYVVQSRADAEKARRSAAEMAQGLEGLRARAEAQKRTAEAAGRIYAGLGSEKPEERGEALADAAKIDKTALSGLESAALEVRAKEVRAELAAGALDRGKAAFRREEWKTAEKELERYLTLDPAGEEAPLALYQLGNARFTLKDYARAVEPLEKFVSAPAGQRNVDFAYYVLGQAYEESAQNAKAAEAYTRGLAHYGQSQFAPMMRRKLAKLSGIPEPSAPPAAPPAPR